MKKLTIFSLAVSLALAFAVLSPPLATAAEPWLLCGGEPVCDMN